MRFRPCIDLHHGQVKQIVGSSLSDQTSQDLVTNFSSDLPPAYYADLYRQHHLTGGHVICLGQGNQAAAQEALKAWPGGLQLGGGVTLDNARTWLEQGASQVIVTSYVFSQGQIRLDRLEALVKAIGKERLVLDLSCRKRGQGYLVVTDRWQKFTDLEVTPATLGWLSAYCSEFLIHAVDVEGKSNGIETNLLKILANWQGLPMTYAGGIHAWQDLKLIQELGQGAIDFTIGSALDLFGGKAFAFADLVQAHQAGFAPSCFAPGL